MPSIARGVRNNNPLNIRRTANDKWVGMAPTQTDKEFVQFIAPEYGIRAGAVLLMNYQDRYHLYTIRRIINRWAPPQENDTDAYVAAVADAVGVDPDADIDVREWAIIRPMIAAMVRQECGASLPDRVIDRGLELAGIVPQTRTVRATMRTGSVRASMISTTSTAIAGAVGVIMPQLGGVDWRVAVAAIVAVAVATIIGVMVWRSTQT